MVQSDHPQPTIIIQFGSDHPISNIRTGKAPYYQSNGCLIRSSPIKLIVNAPIVWSKGSIERDWGQGPLEQTSESISTCGILILAGSGGLDSKG